MNCNEIRSAFLDFFKSKQHTIVPSAPMVIKNDPTLMFTNAGMNQFKDIFLGNQPIVNQRIVDTQKCLRVSGKHNDLEEVGKDTYHHTMFEMLGNWSFGDYFKKEAIEWAWEFLVEVMKLDKSRLYATVFEGDQKDGTEPDLEALEFWKRHLPESHILYGNKKDNFWEMGETGPCGPCSEVHIDLRDDEARTKTAGASLINKDNPLVVEIWNLVFIQYNRLGSGELQKLSANHVDTGMGFERLCMAVQGKKSNYDTDVFQPIIQKIAQLSHKTYGEEEKTDIALRVVADHLRAVSFAIADGQLPSNTGAGYVIRRILRRAIRYGYTFLGFNEPFICQLVPTLVKNMGHAFPELKAQENLIERVIREEENSFLKTLASGIQRFESYCQKMEERRKEKGEKSPSNFEGVDGEAGRGSLYNKIEGAFAFELFDTYGFPIDLTQLLASEKGMTVDMEGFQKGLEEQKNRSRAAATVETEDWVELIKTDKPTEFVGYEILVCESKIVKYRNVKTKGKSYYQIVLEKTPFYAESGGQMGDTGALENINDKIEIVNTVKENNLVVHIALSLPDNLTSVFTAKVNEEKRIAIQNNHTATHLLHFALRKVLGTHVEQKGSMVSCDKFRFDFSHFSKVEDAQLREVESIVNELVRANIPLCTFSDILMEEAMEMGAIALFGEKYEDKVRTIKFGDSVELCGGTHTSATGNIGFVRLLSESAIASGVRRIEAVTGKQAEDYINHIFHLADDLKTFFKSPNIMQAVQKLVQENDKIRKEAEIFAEERIQHFSNDIVKSIKIVNGYHVLFFMSQMLPEVMKRTANNLRNHADHMVIVFGTNQEDKPTIIVALSDDLIAKGLSAVTLVREVAPLIEGGGGGQPVLATAGGKNCYGLEDAMKRVVELVIV
ncbi:MAG: alanine--tRNA ligase [Bacteroidetes bacterium]|nr:alanine--tRNA ligase [Bacteroidota bacterium]MCL2302978.1 alanine--tRNA ligase [Lentimicrobiaceae bacterium]